MLCAGFQARGPRLPLGEFLQPVPVHLCEFIVALPSCRAAPCQVPTGTAAPRVRRAWGALPRGGSAGAFVNVRGAPFHSPSLSSAFCWMSQLLECSASQHSLLSLGGTKTLAASPWCVCSPRQALCTLGPGLRVPVHPGSAWVPECPRQKTGSLAGWRFGPSCGPVGCTGPEFTICEPEKLREHMC